MAPRKRTQTAKNKQILKAPKLEAFLLDFDSEVSTIVGRLKEKTINLLKDADNLYKTALIKIPLTVRKMNWMQFNQMATASSAVDDSKVREEAAQVEVAIAKNHVIPKLAGKGKKSTAGEDESAAPLKCAAKKKARKAPSTSRKARALSISKQSSSIQRSSRKPLITPARSFLESSVIGSTPLITPRFDPRLPKTPALRLARHREKVYSMSVNGSPIAGGGEDVVISVPLGNGECLQLLAGEMDSVDVRQLDERALRSIRNLQNRLTTLCGSSK